MLTTFKNTEYQPRASKLIMPYDTEICQTDYPLDWYHEAFIPYAESFQALPDRKIETVYQWMRQYIEPAQKAFGKELLLLAHYYMGGEIVKLVEAFGGEVGDSYQLALKAYQQPEKKIIVESAVHFMAESISMLAHEDQRVYITNPKAGCTMEMMAKDFMVQPALDALNDRYGRENILPICYMNTSGRIKAMAGAQGGAVCTSSNVKKIFEWALSKNKKIVFIPDQHMGENVAGWVNISPDNIAYWPGGTAGAQYNLHDQDAGTLARFDRSQVVLFCSGCSVHTYYQPEMVEYWKARGYHTVVHPECKKITVDSADSCGSTSFIFDQVTQDKAGTKKYAIGTENHLVDNLKYLCKQDGIEIVSVGDAKINNQVGMGCGCATMSRNDPPHLVGVLDLLRLGRLPEYNEVRPGDVVNEFTGGRQRLENQGQEWVARNARAAMQRMIDITEGKI